MNEQQQQQDKYIVKTIKLGTRRCPIILQSKNGPCPLLGIVNALILRGNKVDIDTTKKLVSSDYLVEVLAAYLLEYANKDMATNTVDPNETEIGVNDALSILPLIKDGLNVNVKFNACNSFENIPEKKIFSLLRMKLVHGWLVDPQDFETASALGELTYTQAVERVFLMRDVIAAEEQFGSEEQSTGDLSHITDYAELTKHLNSPHDFISKLTVQQRERIKKDGRLISDFLESNPSQLTYYGLTSLHEHLADNNLAILFRNNHFSTICKYNGHIHVLVTDEGFAEQEDVVWERLDEIGGDNIYCRGDFSTFHSNQTHEEVMNDIILNEQKRVEQQTLEEQDRALALQLQREEEQRLRSRSNSNNNRQQPSPRQQTAASTSQPTQVILDEEGRQNSVPFGDVPTIRQKREGKQPSPNAGKRNDKYGNQAAQLAELNKQRQEREQVMRTQNPHAYEQAKRSGRAKTKDDKCIIA